MYESYKSEVYINIMGFLNPGCFLSMGILDRTKYQGILVWTKCHNRSLGQNQMICKAGYKREAWCSLLVGI